ncbi:MAG TPA: hypothetical protein VF989_09965 [Polyangiaceae bacterium]
MLSDLPHEYAPEPAPRDHPRRRFHRGKHSPRGVVWFGLRSFWGHLRHFVAAAIATEDVDSRDWMTPDTPAELGARIARRLGAEDWRGDLVSSLGRDVWIDFIADTGDDVSVSSAIAQMLFRSYSLPDPDSPGARLQAPRGDILLFGGDTAYPVATVEEINNRVVVPFNRALERLGDGRDRVLLGIPGNHDWYDGLDGFARMFRRRAESEGEERQRPSVVSIDPLQIERYADWAKEFVRGGQRHKQKRLDLDGYFPVQSASYFTLQLAPRLALLAGDRQLKQVDFRQRRFFSEWLGGHPEVVPIVALPDPYRRFREVSVTGAATVEAMGLDLHTKPHLVLSGDVHHYERWNEGETTHVIAGGGGAFLHPAPLARKGLEPAAVEWPGPRQCLSLLWSVPWKVAQGRSGFIPHLVYASLYAPVFWDDDGELGLHQKLGAMGVFVLVFLVYALIGGIRRRRHVAVSVAAAVAALLTTLSPIGALELSHFFARHWGLPLDPWWFHALAFGLALVLGAYVFGFYLAFLTRIGLETTQAFTALDHPGYKHFVRMRVRAHENRVDVWCIGLEDALAPAERPVLVDAFSFCPKGPPPSPAE